MSRVRVVAEPLSAEQAVEVLTVVAGDALFELCVDVEGHLRVGVAQRQPASDPNGEGRNRTADTTIFSRVLYQLSYLAVRYADGI